MRTPTGEEIKFRSKKQQERTEANLKPRKDAVARLVKQFGKKVAGTVAPAA